MKKSTFVGALCAAALVGATFCGAVLAENSTSASKVAPSPESPTANPTNDRNNDEIKLVYPATEAQETPIRLEARRDPLEPVDEDDEFDVETPIGQVRQVLELLRRQREILERLDARGSGNDRTDEILAALDETPEKIAEIIPASFDSEKLANDFAERFDELQIRVSNERETIVDGVDAKLDDVKTSLQTERATLEDKIDAATAKLAEFNGVVGASTATTRRPATFALILSGISILTQIVVWVGTVWKRRIEAEAERQTARRTESPTQAASGNRL